MTALFSKLFNLGDKSLNAKIIYEKIEFYAKLLLDTDKKIVADEKWRQISDSPKYIIDRLDNFYLFEREILCLAATIISIKKLKDNFNIVQKTISLMIDKYDKLRDVLLMGEIRKVSSSYQEFIGDRMTFYLDELMLYFEMENPSAGRILYYQYYPISRLEEPEVDLLNPAKSKAIILDAYLEMTFHKVTIPIILKELPTTILNYR